MSLDVTRLHSYLYTHFAGLVRLGYGLVTRDVVSSSLERVLEQAGLTEVELDRSSDVVEAEVHRVKNFLKEREVGVVPSREPLAYMTLTEAALTTLSLVDHRFEVALSEGLFPSTNTAKNLEVTLMSFAHLWFAAGLDTSLIENAFEGRSQLSQEDGRQQTERPGNH